MIKLIITKDDIIKIFKDELEKHTRPRFRYKVVKYTVRKYDFTVSSSWKLLMVSRSGYYEWLKNLKLIGNYNRRLLNLISNLYFHHKGIYGVKRLWLEAASSTFTNVSFRTFYHYYKFLNLKAKIRVPKRTREAKASISNKNLIKRNFSATLNRETLFTNVTHYKTKNKWFYISAVINPTNNKIYDIKAQNLII